MRHVLLILERPQHILIHRLAPDHRSRVVHASVDVVLANEGLPLTGAIASWAAAVRRAAPAALRFAALHASVHFSAIRFAAAPLRLLWRRLRRRRGLRAIRTVTIRIVLYACTTVAPRAIVSVVDLPIAAAAATSSVAVGRRASASTAPRRVVGAKRAPRALSITVVRLPGSAVAPGAVVLRLARVPVAAAATLRRTAVAITPGAVPLRRDL